MNLLRLGIFAVVASGALVGANNFAQAAAAEPGVFYVATNGNDSWTGLRSAHSTEGPDGPFASLTGALDAVRRWRHAGPGVAPQAGTIIIRGGNYFIAKPLVLQPEDSDLTLAAYGNEQPVISAGRKIDGWKQVTVEGRTLWRAEAPKQYGTNLIFRELWINGERGVRARHPNKGYLSIESLAEAGGDWRRGQMRFRFRAGDLRPWKKAPQADAVVMTRWVESRLPILELDDAGRYISFTKRSVFELAPGDLYYLEGALDWLDQPGEWCLNGEEGAVFYLPRPGEELNGAEAIAPALAQIVRLEGRPDLERFIERVTFRGLTFSHSEWYYPEAAVLAATNTAPSGFSQAAIGVPGAVWGKGVRGCDFEHCSFSHIGNYGLELARGCSSNKVSACNFFDLGAGGLKLGEQEVRGRASEQSRGNEIVDCHLHDGGKLFPSAVGIWLGQTADNYIAHNLVHDFFYTGISIGWTWGYGPALATNNLVEFNHVHHIGIKSNGDGPILSDMGGIYTLGRQPGTRIVNNLWHDIAAVRYGGWGIYFDEGSSGILAASNLVYRTTHGGFHQHYGETNVVWNNIFAFGRDQQLQRTRSEPHRSFNFQTNIVFFDSGSLLAGDWSGDKFKMDSNLYFDARRDAKAGALQFGGATFAKWRESGHDLKSAFANPLFSKPQAEDFRLGTNSPAFGLGFLPIDLTGIGIRSTRTR